MLTLRFELRLTALFSQPSYFYEEPLPPLPVDVISWRRCTIPCHANILYRFKELIFAMQLGFEPKPPTPYVGILPLNYSI